MCRTFFINILLVTKILFKDIFIIRIVLFVNRGIRLLLYTFQHIKLECTCGVRLWLALFLLVWDVFIYYQWFCIRICYDDCGFFVVVALLLLKIIVIIVVIIAAIAQQQRPQMLAWTIQQHAIILSLIFLLPLTLTITILTIAIILCTIITQIVKIQTTKIVRIYLPWIILLLLIKTSHPHQRPIKNKRRLPRTVVCAILVQVLLLLQ